MGVTGNRDNSLKVFRELDNELRQIILYVFIGQYI